MMDSTTGLILWPAGLPLPYVDSQGQPQHSTLAGGLQQMRIQRRRRFHSFTVSLSARWVLTILEYDSFKAFFRDELFNGIAQFSLLVRYPYSSTLTEWKVRFLGNYTAVFQEGIWLVESTLELLEQIPEVELVPALPLALGFQVVDEEESAGYVQFVTADGNDFHVKPL